MKADFPPVGRRDHHTVGFGILFLVVKSPKADRVDDDFTTVPSSCPA
jgi:hypothetical protein